MGRTSIVRSKRGRGELCADEGKRRVVHHEWRLERGGDSFFDGSTVGRGGYIGDGAIFRRRKCIAGRSGKSVGRWEVVMARGGIHWGEACK